MSNQKPCNFVYFQLFFDSKWIKVDHEVLFLSYARDCSGQCQNSNLWNKGSGMCRNETLFHLNFVNADPLGLLTK